MEEGREKRGFVFLSASLSKHCKLCKTFLRKKYDNFFPQRISEKGKKGEEGSKTEEKRIYFLFASFG